MLGFNERHSNRVVDIAECPVLVPALAACLPAIRTLLQPLVDRRPARVTLLRTQGGVDMTVEGVRPPSAAALPKLVALAGEASLARLTVGGEPVALFAEPSVEIANIKLVPPPGAFLQASAEAERIMTDLVVSHLAGARKIADLFSGVGTFALSLARTSRVVAAESSQPALDALTTAARGASGLKRIETERRDLFTHPLSPQELATFDGAAFDPPRAGAKSQATALAASKIPCIAAVSCNPASFARDARILIDGGYLLERVVPVDQFVYSAETEVVGLFSRR